MKVLFESNRCQKKRVLLLLSNGTKAKEVRRILKQQSRDRAIKKLILKSTGIYSICPDSKESAHVESNFFVSNDYTCERLI